MGDRPGAASASASRTRPSRMSPRVLQKRTSAPANRNATSIVAGRGCPGERGADVVVLLVEPVEPHGLVLARQLRLGRLDQLEVALGVAAAHLLELTAFLELLERVLADRLEQPEARLAVRRRPTAGRGSCRRATRAFERLRRTPFPRGRNGIRELERAAAGEDAEPGEERLLGRLEQVVAPVDRVPQRALALGQVAGAAGQQVEPVLEPARRSPAAMSSFTRAAASSIASGRPSSRRQIAATASSFSSVSSNPGLTACARSTKSCDRGEPSASGDVAVGPAERGAVPGTRAPRAGAAAPGSSRAPSAAGARRAVSWTSVAAGSTCSKLSSTSSAGVVRQAAARSPARPTPGRRSPRRRGRAAIAEPDDAGLARSVPGRRRRRGRALRTACRRRRARAGSCRCRPGP